MIEKVLKVHKKCDMELCESFQKKFKIHQKN